MMRGRRRPAALHTADSPPGGPAGRRTAAPACRRPGSGGIGQAQQGTQCRGGDVIATHYCMSPAKMALQEIAPA